MYPPASSQLSETGYVMCMPAYHLQLLLKAPEHSYGDAREVKD